MAINDIRFREPGNIGYPIINKCAQYTTAQTGVALWTPSSGTKIVVTSFQIQAFAVTGGAVQVWFGASGDTTYSRGTDLAVFDGEFAPSATNKPGVMVAGGFWKAGTDDHILRVTSSANISITVNVWGYEAP